MTQHSRGPAVETHRPVLVAEKPTVEALLLHHSVLATAASRGVSLE